MIYMYVYTYLLFIIDVQDREIVAEPESEVMLHHLLTPQKRVKEERRYIGYLRHEVHHTRRNTSQSDLHLKNSSSTVKTEKKIKDLPSFLPQRLVSIISVLNNCQSDLEHFRHSMHSTEKQKAFLHLSLFSCTPRIVTYPKPPPHWQLAV